MFVYMNVEVLDRTIYEGNRFFEAPGMGRGGGELDKFKVWSIGDDQRIHYIQLHRSSVIIDYRNRYSVRNNDIV